MRLFVAVISVLTSFLTAHAGTNTANQYTCEELRLVTATEFREQILKEAVLNVTLFVAQMTLEEKAMVLEWSNLRSNAVQLNGTNTAHIQNLGESLKSLFSRLGVQKYNDYALSGDLSYYPVSIDFVAAGVNTSLVVEWENLNRAFMDIDIFMLIVDKVVAQIMPQCPEPPFDQTTHSKMKTLREVDSGLLELLRAKNNNQ